MLLFYGFLWLSLSLSLSFSLSLSNHAHSRLRSVARSLSPVLEAVQYVQGSDRIPFVFLSRVLCIMFRLSVLYVYTCVLYVYTCECSDAKIT